CPACRPQICGYLSGVSKTLTIAGLLLVAALGLPIVSIAPAQPHPQTSFSTCCCADQSETLPPSAPGALQRFHRGSTFQSAQKPTLVRGRVDSKVHDTGGGPGRWGR
ncbi:MAG: hypothetical protein ACKOLA_06800, partial [Spartobacteria bacterium]